MQTRHTLVRTGLVAATACGLILGAAGLATAQRRLVDIERVVTSPDLEPGSRIGLSIDEVADGDGVTEGAVVQDVLPDSPAASAGFAAGDIIVEFDRERVRSARQLTRLVRETPAGRTVSAAVRRAGGRVELEVTPQAGPSMVAARRPAFEEEVEDVVTRGFGPEERRGQPIFGWSPFEPARLGITAQEVSGQLADYFGVDGGVLVSSVAEDSIGAEAGLQAGDVITSVDGRDTTDIATLRRRLSATGPGEDTELGVTRRGQQLDLIATVPDESRPRRRMGRRPGDGRGV